MSIYTLGKLKRSNTLVRRYWLIPIAKKKIDSQQLKEERDRLIKVRSINYILGGWCYIKWKRHSQFRPPNSEF